MSRKYCSMWARVDAGLVSVKRAYKVGSSSGCIRRLPDFSEWTSASASPLAAPSCCVAGGRRDAWRVFRANLTDSDSASFPVEVIQSVCWRIGVVHGRCGVATHNRTPHDSTLYRGAVAHNNTPAFIIAASNDGEDHHVQRPVHKTRR